jgi:hypothetical protein
MYRYRQTPERIRKLDDIQRLWDAAQKNAVQNDQLRKPAPGLTGLELQFSEEDRVIEEYGQLMVFDWTVRDESGRTEFVRGVSTETESVVRALDRWDKMDYKPKGRVVPTRDNSTAVPAPNQPYIYSGGRHADVR